jgi:hypothetical protein
MPSFGGSPLAFLLSGTRIVRLKVMVKSSIVTPSDTETFGVHVVRSSSISSVLLAYDGRMMEDEMVIVLKDELFK